MDCSAEPLHIPHPHTLQSLSDRLTHASRQSIDRHASTTRRPPARVPRARHDRASVAALSAAEVRVRETRSETLRIWKTLQTHWTESTFGPSSIRDGFDPNAYSLWGGHHSVGAISSFARFISSDGRSQPLPRTRAHEARSSVSLQGYRVPAVGYGFRGQLRRKCTTPTRPNTKAPSMYHAGKVTAAATPVRARMIPAHRGAGPRHVRIPNPTNPRAKANAPGT